MKYDNAEPGSNIRPTRNEIG